MELTQGQISEIISNYTSSSEGFVTLQSLIMNSLMAHECKLFVKANKNEQCNGFLLGGINNNCSFVNRFAVLVVICLKISTFVVSTTTFAPFLTIFGSLWFAWKYLPLWYQQQPHSWTNIHKASCDLLENIYLCGINNNLVIFSQILMVVVICLKISIFVVSTTTILHRQRCALLLWFAWKYLSLWYQQQLIKLKF